MTLLRALLLCAAIGLSACEMIPTPGVSPPPQSGGSPPATTPRAGAPIPSTPIDLGDYRVGSSSGVIVVFSNAIARRYGVGEALNAVASDLRRNSFFCGRPVSTRGQLPDQVCKRIIREGGCDHVWQVFTFDDRGNQRLVKVRSLYDRKCGPDALLGAPG